MSTAAEQLRCCRRCRSIYRKESAFCPADGGEIVDVDADPLVGETLEHYVIEALLGEGAMGRVYRAHHHTLVHKRYAIKVMLGDLASTASSRQRFVNEAKHAGMLHHPNVVSVVDFGRSQAGLVYLVMELVEGALLDDLIKDPIEPTRAAFLARGIAEGLHHAHALGLVHRDLKPENVIVVSRDGAEVPRIVDFGIAVGVDHAELRLTSTGMALGTPAYIAPEQVVGSGGFDARADQYALGVTLFEMLTGGQLPFFGDAMAVVRSKVVEVAPRVTERMPEGLTLPSGLADIVARMLERDPGARYADMTEVAIALSRYGDPAATEPVSFARPRGRRRIVLGGAIAATLAVVGAAGAWALASRPPSRTAAPPPAPPPPPPTIAAAPIEVAAADPPPELEIDEPIADRSPTLASPPRRTHPAKRPNARTKPAAIVKPVNVATALADAGVTPPPPLPPPPPAPPTEITLVARVAGFTVRGALSRGDVERALERVRPTIEHCTTLGATAQTATLAFVIDDGRRARDIRGSGVAPAALACVIAALGGVRTEGGADVGTADVSVTVAFGAKR